MEKNLSFATNVKPNRALDISFGTVFPAEACFCLRLEFQSAPNIDLGFGIRI